ncbi:MAG: hypothetical protein GC137_07185 [Alphaproteobacteria bacterium]|nr:hypothetical protein [Alphaproteobacteria bacterium]
MYIIQKYCHKERCLIKRVGILGGSYNPGHLGHRHVAEQALEHLGLNEVWLWVSHNIFKDPADYASSQDREDLCTLLCEGHPRLKVITMEKDFCDRLTATSMTTLAALHPQTQFTWIFGDDNFANFHNWNREMFMVDGKRVPDWQYLLNRFPIAVMHRSGYRDEAKKSIAAAYGKALYEANPARLCERKNGWTFVDNSSLSISSTAVKQALKNHQRRIDGLPLRMEQAIYDKGLFGTGDNIVGIARLTANNSVPFDIFLLLAAGVHAAKSAIRYNFSAPDFSSYTAYFEAGWEQAIANANDDDDDTPANRLPDCLITLCHLAARQGISLNGAKASGGISPWLGQDDGLNVAISRHLESLGALCASANMEKQRAANLLTIAFEAPDTLDPATAHRNNLNALHTCAARLCIDLSGALNTDAPIPVEKYTRNLGVN